MGFSYDKNLERYWEFYDEDFEEDSYYINNHSNFSIGDDNHFPVPEGMKIDKEDEKKYYHMVC